MPSPYEGEGKKTGANPNLGVFRIYDSVHLKLRDCHPEPECNGGHDDLLGILLLDRMDERADERHREVIEVISALKAT